LTEVSWRHLLGPKPLSHKQHTLRVLRLYSP